MHDDGYGPTAVEVAVHTPSECSVQIVHRGERFDALYIIEESGAGDNRIRLYNFSSDIVNRMSMKGEIYSRALVAAVQGALDGAGYGR